MPLASGGIMGMSVVAESGLQRTSGGPWSKGAHRRCVFSHPVVLADTDWQGPCMSGKLIYREFAREV